MHVFWQAKKILGSLKRTNPALFESGIDKTLVLIGAILHDIGRTKSHGIDHGLVGGQILSELKAGEALKLIAERHIGGGIPRLEAEKLGLPPMDYLPTSIEEKLVCFADKLVDYRFYKHSKNWWCIEDWYDFTTSENEISKLRRALGSSHLAIKRVKDIEEYLLLLNNGPYSFSQNEMESSL